MLANGMFFAQKVAGNNSPVNKFLEEEMHGEKVFGLSAFDLVVGSG